MEGGSANFHRVYSRSNLCEQDFGVSLREVRYCINVKCIVYGVLCKIVVSNIYSSAYL